MLTRLLKLIVRIKVYMARSMSYLSMINSAMILFLLLSSLEKYGIDLNIETLLVPIVLLSLLVLIAWGYIEDRLGLWEYEQAVSQDRSKFNYRVMKRLDALEEKLDKYRISNEFQKCPDCNKVVRLVK